MYFSLGKYDISVNLRAKRPWSHFKIHTHSKDHYSKHLVWGKLSLQIEDAVSESADYSACKLCDSTEISFIPEGDEGLTICQDCGAVEQGYQYLSKRQWEAL